MKEFYIILFVLTFLFQIILSKKIYGYLLNPITVFNIIFFLHNWSFSFSRIFFSYLEWYTPNDGDKYDSQLLLINLSCLWAFFTAMLLFKKNVTSKIHIIYDFNIYLKFFYLTIFITLVQTVGNQNTVYGSDQAIDAASSYNPLGILLFAHCIFGGIILINTKSKRIIYTILVLELLVAIFTGTRKAFIIIIFTYLISKFEFIKIKFNLSKTILGIVVISIVFYFTVFLAVFRESFGSSMSFNDRIAWTNEFIFKDVGKILVYTINSANSEAVQTWVLELVEEGKLQPTYGLTYVQAIANTIILRPFQGELVNYQAAYYFKKVAYPDVQNQGYDFSFTAEGILNWQNFSFISYFIMGAILSKIYNKRFVNNYYNTLYVLVIALLYVVLRTDSTSFFRYLSFFIFTFILFKIFNIIKSKKHVKNFTNQ